MLASTAAFADLRTALRNTVGTEPGDSTHDLSVLLAAFHPSATVSKRGGVFKVEVPELAVQQALLADVEKAYGKFLAQFITYGILVGNEVEAVWRAVTAYYGCIYAATSLLAATGTTLRRLPPTGIIPGGLWSISTAPSANTTTPHVLITGDSGGGAGSHQRTWKRLQDLLHSLAAVSPNSRDGYVLSAAAAMVDATPSFSEFRNEINYSVDQGPWSREVWPCLVRDITSETELEDAIIRGAKCNEQRLELIMLACGSLTKSLLNDYYATTKRVDYRPRTWRRQHSEKLASTPFEHAKELVYQ